MRSIAGKSEASRLLLSALLFYNSGNLAANTFFLSCHFNNSHGKRSLHSATRWSILGTKDYILIFKFSSHFDDFLQLKPPIL